MATKIRSKWVDGNLVFTDDAGNKIFSLDGVNKQVVLDDDSQVVKVAKVSLGAADTGGGVFSWQNPEGKAIIVQRVLVDVTTAATGACTIDVGTTATNATTSSDNLIDGADIGTATGVFDNYDNSGTNGKTKQKLADGKWVTGSRASGAAAGTAGFAYIEYVVI